MYQIKYKNGYEILVIRAGISSPCRVVNQHGQTRFEGTYTACSRFLAEMGVKPFNSR